MEKSVRSFRLMNKKKAKSFQSQTSLIEQNEKVDGNKLEVKVIQPKKSQDENGTSHNFFDAQDIQIMQHNYILKDLFFDFRVLSNDYFMNTKFNFFIVHPNSRKNALLSALILFLLF